MGRENSWRSSRIRGETRESRRRRIKIFIKFNECFFLSGAEILPYWRSSSRSQPGSPGWNGKEKHESDDLSPTLVTGGNYEGMVPSLPEHKYNILFFIRKKAELNNQQNKIQTQCIQNEIDKQKSKSKKTRLARAHIRSKKDVPAMSHNVPINTTRLIQEEKYMHNVLHSSLL